MREENRREPGAALRIAIGVATTGRRELVSDLVALLALQSRPPDEILVCPAADGDVEPGLGAGLPFPVKVVWGGKGLSAQRNRIMQAGDADILVFLDDDYVAAADYLAHCEAVFRANPDVVMLTGSVIEDGVFGPGLDLAYALRRLDADPGVQTETLTPTYNGYGCNMAFRTAPMRRHELRFDENLPLYGWLEDVDFSRSLAPYGRIVRSRCCRGVHLGVKRGRTSGVRLGYSQVANPVYLWRKGRMGGRRAFAQVLRNLAANTAKYFFAEPWVDRKGRLHGNLCAMADALLGKLHPTRMLGL